MFASFIVAASFVFFALAGSSIVGIIIGTIILFSGVGGVFVAADQPPLFCTCLQVEPAQKLPSTWCSGISAVPSNTTVTGALLTLYAAPIIVAIPGGTTIVLAPTTQAFTYVVVVALVLGLLGTRGCIRAQESARYPDS